MKRKIIIAVLSTVLMVGATTGVVVATRHTHDFKVTITAPTCTESGYTTHACECGETYTDSYVSAIGHDWEDATCGLAKTCSMCNQTSGEALGHTPSPAVVENNVAPDCVNDGSYDNVVYCSVCDEEMRFIIVVR